MRETEHERFLLLIKRAGLELRNLWHSSRYRLFLGALTNSKLWAYSYCYGSTCEMVFMNINENVHTIKIVSLVHSLISIICFKLYHQFKAQICHLFTCTVNNQKPIKFVDRVCNIFPILLLKLLSETWTTIYYSDNRVRQPACLVDRRCVGLPE